MAEKVKSYTKTVFTNDEKKIKQLQRKPQFNDKNFLECEDMESGITEIISAQSRVVDNKPVHIGITILQYSKLLMLRFVRFLNEHLVKDSFSLVYTGKYRKPITEIGFWEYHFRHGQSRNSNNAHGALRCKFPKRCYGEDFFANRSS